MREIGEHGPSREPLPRARRRRRQRDWLRRPSSYGSSSIERLLPAGGRLAAAFAGCQGGIAAPRPRKKRRGWSERDLHAGRGACPLHRASGWLSKPCHSLHAVLFVEAHVS
jgi:hypothetical protein